MRRWLPESRPHRPGLAATGGAALSANVSRHPAKPALPTSFAFTAATFRPLLVAGVRRRLVRVRYRGCRLGGVSRPHWGLWSLKQWSLLKARRRGCPLDYPATTRGSCAAGRRSLAAGCGLQRDRRLPRPRAPAVGSGLAIDGRSRRHGCEPSGGRNGSLSVVQTREAPSHQRCPGGLSPRPRGCPLG